MRTQELLADGGRDRELLLLRSGEVPLGPPECHVERLGLCRGGHPSTVCGKEGPNRREVVPDCGDCQASDRDEERDRGLGCQLWGANEGAGNPRRKP